jgi:hypothetical protein
MAAIAALDAGCVLPFPVPQSDRPPDVAPVLPAELATGFSDTLVLVVMSQGGGVTPLFVKPQELAAIAKKLERSSVEVGFLVFIPSPAGFGFATGGVPPNLKVSELCLIAADGRTVSLRRRGDSWVPSTVSSVDAVWRDQIAKYVAENRPATVLKIWTSSPCLSVDLTGVSINKWTDEQRTRVSEFLMSLPLKQ